MDTPHTTVATPMGTLLVWSYGADDLQACTLSAQDKGSWTYRNLPEVDAVAETISVNGRPRTLRLHLVTVARLQANTASAAARQSGYAYQEECRWSHGRWGMNWTGLELPGGSEAAKERVRTALLPFLATWADSDDGHRLLHKAEERRLGELVERLDREAAEAEQRAAELRAQHAAAAVALADHRGGTAGEAAGSR
jgi:hypothetical protein